MAKRRITQKIRDPTFSHFGIGTIPACETDRQTDSRHDSHLVYLLAYRRAVKISLTSCIKLLCPKMFLKVAGDGCQADFDWRDVR